MSRLTTLKRRSLQHSSVRQARAGRELTRLVRTLARSVLFDRELYQWQRGRKFPTTAAAAWDYVVVGSRLGLVAGPLLVPPVAATGRRSGIGPASWWAAQVRAAGFPRTTAHPLADLAAYAAEHPEAASWRGGPLAHYTERGRAQGFRLGPLDPGGTDLVALGWTALGAPVPVQLGPTSSAAVDIAADIATERVEVGTSAVVVALRSRETLGVIATLLDPISEVDEIVVVADADAAPELRVTVAALELLAPRVRVVRPDGVDVIDDILTAARGDALLVVTTAVVATPADIARLVRDGDLDAAGPVVLAADDTVRSAGLVDRVDLHESGTLVPILRDHPWADAVRAGDRRVDALSGEVVALRRRALTGLAAAAATDDPDAVVTVLTRSMAAAGGAVGVVSSATVGLVRPPGAVPAGTGGSGADGAPLSPLQPGRAAYADPADGTLRWAIKSPHPSGPRRRTWGDFHFANALAASLERLGHEVAVDPLDSWYRATAAADDVTLTIRGLHRHRPSPRQINLLWVISHPELVSGAELDEVDSAFAASLSWSRRMTTAGHRVAPMLQCTDAAVFQPEAGEPGSGYPLLFVGNSRSARRPLVDAAIATGRDLAVIGGGWAGRIPPERVMAEYADNATLPRLYRNAGVVLNDHWSEMANEGFLSNRLFDLTASGARWVSDPATDLLEVFPTGRVAADGAELVRLLDGAPATFPTEEALLEASRIVRAEHSFDARAAQLSEAVATLVAQRD
jgi:hypothetical protein